MKCLLSFSLVGLFFLVFSHRAFAQTQQNQISQPSFLPADEKVLKIINDNIYYVGKKDFQHTVSINGKPYTTRDTNGTQKIYFTDRQGKILNTFNIFPSTTILSAFDVIRYSKKFITIKRSYQDKGKLVMDGFLLDSAGKILWHIPKKVLESYMFPCDKNDSVMMIDAWKGFLKIYSVNGVEKTERYFTDQSDKKYKDLAAEDLEDVSFDGDCEASDNGDYIAVGRNSVDFPDFQSELTLLDSSGNIIFQNKEPQSKAGEPLKISADLKIIVVDGAIRTQLANHHYLTQEIYYGIDFTGKKLWELDSYSSGIYPGELKNGLLKDDELIVKRHLTSDPLNLNLNTGEIK
jgi:hypothetical protein